MSKAAMVNYERFERLLSNSLWTYAGRMRTSPTTCAVHYEHKASRLPIEVPDNEIQ